MNLTPAMEQYVLHWGEMGTRWGTNRSVAQIHALLYLSDKPLPADEITETLGIARSNVSNSLKELQGWGLVRVIHVMGDRRDHFQALEDTWEILLTIVEERKKREIDPTIMTLRQCVAEAGSDRTPADVAQRMETMLTFVDTMNDWYEQVSSLPKPTLVRLMKMGRGIARLLPGGKAKAK